MDTNSDVVTVSKIEKGVLAAARTLWVVRNIEAQLKRTPRRQQAIGRRKLADARARHNANIQWLRAQLRGNVAYRNQLAVERLIGELPDMADGPIGPGVRVLIASALA